jgi:hypothetical protein
MDSGFLRTGKTENGPRPKGAGGSQKMEQFCGIRRAGVHVNKV